MSENVHKLRSLQDSRTGVKKEQVKTKLFKQLHVVRVFGGLLLANLISWLPVIVLSLASRDFWRSFAFS